MRGSAQGGKVALVTVALTIAALGCAPRGAVYREINASRRQSYVRWREEYDEHDLPRLEGELSIADAVQVALEYNKALQAVVQQKAQARGRVVEAYGEALPRLDLSAGYTRLDRIFVVDLGVTQFTIGDKDNWNYRVDLVQPLFKGGAIPAAIRGARIFRYLSDESVRRAVQDAILSTAISYYDVLLASHLFEVQEAALRFAEANLDDVRARERQGLAIRYDVLRAQLEVSNVKADLIRQRNELNRARTQLFRSMGVSQKSEVDLTDSLTYLLTEPTYQRAVEVAYANRPDLFTRELDVRLQQETLRGLRADYLPNLEAWAWHLWAKPDPHESSNIEWDTQWQAGLRLTWNLFDGLRREGKIIQQNALLRQSEIGLIDAEQAVLQEVLDAILNLGDAEELVQSQRFNLVQANEALRLVQLGAREGVNTELEVLDARAALTKASGLYYQALHAHITARVRLQRTLGVLGPAPGEGDVPSKGPEPGAVAEFIAPGQEWEELPTAPVTGRPNEPTVPTE